jgi:negative regulator of flagellin synthesis FlgM
MRSREDIMSTVDMGNVSKPQTGDSSGRLSRAESASPSRSISGPSGAESGRVAPSDAVSLSQSAAEIAALEGQLKSLSGVDQARVDSIRQSISEGSYTVDTDKVIDGLLSAEKSLL